MSASAVTVAVRATAGVPPEIAFERTRAIDPATVFTGRGVLPAVVATTEGPGRWSRTGATRELAFSDGGTAREELTTYQAGSRYAYDVAQFTNVVRLLLSGMRCEWRFTEDTSGVTVVEWEVALHPLSYRHGIVRRFFAPAWRRYMDDILGRTIARIDSTSAGNEHVPD
ncbi:polyketide cyclase/dehydrase/lipid transport protein [Promicromonospora sp. AC04]|uniref:SRPBCC family protein n=1 Tax=Promicromonospora sp. AC04 TaxID=2135723 RepID=UPI000D35183E|nr:SRPBCC family protein [Promicromonospora sp. AC04]PUB23462.1 polyketide cyclase/dehydrase/lipid transport protein [Promicromonospora sp. AC04]